jgi:hypothetical protein
MAKIEKREDGWHVEGYAGTFTSRDAARAFQADNPEAVAGAAQDEAEATYAENLAASEALDAATDTEADALVADVNREFPGAENFVGGFDTEEQELATRVERVTVEDVANSLREDRARDNYLFMATHTEGPAQRYWITKVQEKGWGDFLDPEYVAGITS